MALIKLKQSINHPYQYTDINYQFEISEGTRVTISGYGKFGAAKYYHLKQKIESRVLEIANNSSDPKVKFLLSDYKRRIIDEEAALSKLKEEVSKFSYGGKMTYPQREISDAAAIYRSIATSRNASEFNDLLGDQLKNDDKLNALLADFYATDPQGAGDGKLYAEVNVQR